MPVLKKLHTEHYKNLENQDLRFCPGLNVLAGPNGAGKTNLLDAVQMLSMTKSAFSVTEQQVIQHRKDYYALEGSFELGEERLAIWLAYQKGRGKVLKNNDKPYEKLSEHIGKLPVVFFTPSDSDYIRGASELRRKFMDSLISQYDHGYLLALHRFNQALSSRNRILKDSHGRPDPRLLAAFDVQLLEPAKRIVEARKAFTEDFSLLVHGHYLKLCQNKEQSEMLYVSKLLDEDYASLLQEAQPKDFALHYTTVGPHRDDWKFSLNAQSLRKLGSQGQQKSYAIALQLARRDLLVQKLGQKPILLLDDIFGKLDDQRMASLLELLAPDGFQIFLTDARPQEAQRLMEVFDAEKAFFLVKNGTITAQ